MFAYAGASTFPTIQADMRDRGKFIYAAILAITILFLIYFPVAVGCYFSLGDQVTENIVLAMSSGWQRVVVEIMLLLHLITTFPIITNPPAQAEWWARAPRFRCHKDTAPLIDSFCSWKPLIMP